MTTRFNAGLFGLFAAAFLVTGPLLLPITAHAATGVELKQGNLTLSGFFALATLPNQPAGAGFLTIANDGPDADRLVSATSPMAATVQIHEMKMDGDVMKMSALPDGLPLPAGETVVLAPGGYHIMFMDLTAAFVEGGLVPVTLTFEKAGGITLELPVISRDAAKGMATPDTGTMTHKM